MWQGRVGVGCVCESVCGVGGAVGLERGHLLGVWAESTWRESVCVCVLEKCEGESNCAVDMGVGF